MKKISLFALALSTSLALFAQDKTSMAVQPRFGIRGGVNLASLELDDDNTTTNWNTNSKTSFHAGVFVNLPLAGMFALQPEVSYVGQGSKVTGTPLTGSSSPMTYEVDVHYIAVPIMAQVKTPGGFFVEAGPQLGILLSAKQDNQSGEDPDIKKLFRTTDFGLAGGIGYLSRIGLGLNARYVHGLSNVFNTDDAPSGTADREISNRGVQIGLVYHFGAYK